MRKIIFLSLLLVVCLAVPAFAAFPVTEFFSGPTLQNTYEQFWTIDATLASVSAGTDGIPDAPGGNGWIGKMSAVHTGAATSGQVIGDFTDVNYTLQAWVWTPVVNAADLTPEAYWYQMLVFYRQTATADYGRIHTHFNTVGDPVPAPRIRCQIAPSTWYTREWTSPTDFTAPTEAGWHKLKIEITGTTAVCYFDGVKLPDPQPDWTADKPARNAGKFGFGQYLDGAGTPNLYLDNFKVWTTGGSEPAEPTPTPVPLNAQNWTYYE